MSYQSVSCLTSLLKLDKYRDISSSEGDNFLKLFWRHSWDVGTLVPNKCKFLYVLSVCLLAYFIIERAKFWHFKGPKGAAWQASWHSGLTQSPPVFSPIISSAFALWVNAELYILGPSLPFFLSFFLSPFLPPFLRKKVGKIAQFWC